MKGKLLKNVTAYLTIEQQKNNPNLTDGIIRRMHKKAPDEIRKALQSFGYYKPGIRNKLKKEDSAWHATYTIDIGEPVVITEIDLQITGQGGEEEYFKTISEKFMIKKGEVLEHEHYEKVKVALQEKALEEGYLDAKIKY